MEKDDTVLRHYILITPAKNEGDNIPQCIPSVANQTIKPVLWVIVDDGSTDNTPELIKEAKEKYEWIQSIISARSARDLGIHYAYICKKGFDFAVEYCKENGIGYDYIGSVDADVKLEEAYFEDLIKEFEKDNKLGIASGETWSIIGNQVIRAKQQEDLASGAARLLRKECFEEIGGYTQTCALDAVTNVKAKLRGWKVKRFKECRFTQQRLTSSADGLWNGWKMVGETAYYLNVPPLFAIVKSIRFLFEKPYYIGLAYLLGYLNSYVTRKEKTNDEEIKQYYRYIRPQEHKKSYWNNLKFSFRKSP